MKLGSILKTVGKTALSIAFPGGSAVLDLVNTFLPGERKLDNTATGMEVEAAINSLPPAEKASLLEKELDVEIASITSWTDIVKSLAEADATGSSTRPAIALMMGEAVAFGIVVSISAWSIALLTNEIEMMKALRDTWPLLATLLGIPVGLLNSYFGKRMKEKKARYEMASGVQAKKNLITNLISIFKK